MRDLNGKSIICEETNKVCYTEREAGSIINDCRKHGYRKWGVEHKDKPMRKYYCKYCGCWHTTHFKSYYAKNPKSKRLKLIMSAIMFAVIFAGF